MSWKKFVTFNSAPSVTTYPELPDQITWFRLFLGLIYGISLGFRESATEVKLKGGSGIIFGLNAILFLPILYLNVFLKAQTDTYKQLNYIGVPNAMAVMLLVWIIFFTMIHEEEEGVLGSAISEPSTDVITDEIPVRSDTEF